MGSCDEATLTNSAFSGDGPKLRCARSGSTCCEPPKFRPTFYSVFVDRTPDPEESPQPEIELRQVLDLVPQLIAVFGPDRNRLYANQPALEYFGLTLDEWQAITDPLWFFHPDDRGRIAKDVYTGDESEAPHEFEARMRRHDGEYRWFLFRSNPLRDEEGRIKRWYLSATDIEDRKRAEEELQASEVRFRTLVDNVADAILLRSDDGKLVDANQQACDSLGYTRDELLGMTSRGFVDPTVDASLNRWIGDQLKAGAVFSFESRHRRKDGTVFPVEVRVRPFWKGGRQFSLASIRDITERKQAEDALRQSEKQLLDVIETIPALAWTTRADGSVDFINRRWQEYTGISAREAIGRGWQVAIHPNDIDRIVEKRSASRESGVPFEGEVRIHSRDGEYRWFLCRATPLRNERGNVVRWYGTATDIDDRKRAEERLQRENVVLREEIDRASMFEEIVGTSPALQKVLTAVFKVASADSTVLIVGETGTGKELVARAIHKKSLRSARPFVTVNCAAIPQSLIASELFGHEKGAFTGALQRRLGRFELAEAGTIFLDEVGELPMETQVALLRVLQEREFQRVGGNQAIRLNVRVLAATNRDLQKATATGVFRQDLFYRLNVFPIHIPPLRERKQDIPLLVEYFIDRFSRNSGKIIRSIDKASLELCKSYSWPGNIRELQNVIERAVIICETEILSIDESWLSQGDSRTQTSSGLGKKSPAEERELIEEVLTETEGRVAGPSGAAAKLGIPPSTLEYKIRLLKINKHQFKKYLRED